MRFKPSAYNSARRSAGVAADRRDGSVPCLVDGGSRAADVGQKLSELRVDVLVAAADEEIHVLDHLQHRAAQREDLRCNLRPVAVVDAIVAALKDRTVPLLELLLRPPARRLPVCGTEGSVGSPGNAEEVLPGVRPLYPSVEQVAEELD